MTSISKNIVNKYNNTYHGTIEMKAVNVKLSIYIDLSVENNEKDPKFKVSDRVTIQNIKTFLQNVTNEIGQNKFFLLKKLKILYHALCNRRP